MCLITEQKKPLIAKEDMVVYKYLEKIKDTHRFKSLYYSGSKHEYVLDVIYDIIIKDTPLGNGLGYDNLANQHIEKLHDDLLSYNFKCNMRGKIERLQRGGYVRSLGQGFHFFLNKNRVTSPINGVCEIPINGTLCKCIVPKGSEYYLDKSGLGISGSIKVVETVGVLKCETDLQKLLKE